MNNTKRKLYRRQKRHDKQMWKKEVGQEILFAVIKKETPERMEET